ncbi:hypothetical protein ABIB82_000786 [Bradyrhizobium sp. i1.8.4]
MRRGPLALDREEYPRPQTTMEGFARLKGGVSRRRRLRAGRQGDDYRKLILEKHTDLDINFVHHAGNSSDVVDGSAAIPLASPRIDRGRHAALCNQFGQGLMNQLVVVKAERRQPITGRTATRARTVKVTKLRDGRQFWSARKDLMPPARLRRALLIETAGFRNERRRPICCPAASTTRRSRRRRSSRRCRRC